MNNFFLVTNKKKDPDYLVTSKVRDYLVSRQKSCVIFSPETSDDKGRAFFKKDDIPKETDCIISLGGDGTLLRTARLSHGSNIPLIGINLGNLGFLAQISRNTIYESIEKLISGDYETEERMMLYGEIIRNEDVIVRDTALNDIIISRGGYNEMLRLNNYVDGSFLNSYRSDGIIAATPTGSTGYSLAAGGPIIDPKSRLIMLTPLAPQSLINRSVIHSADSMIEIELGADKDGGKVRATASFDGDTRVPVATGDIIRITASRENARLVKINQGSFWETLRYKMSTLM